MNETIRQLDANLAALREANAATKAAMAELRHAVADYGVMNESWQWYFGQLLDQTQAIVEQILRQM